MPRYLQPLGLFALLTACVLAGPAVPVGAGPALDAAVGAGTITGRITPAGAARPASVHFTLDGAPVKPRFSRSTFRLAHVPAGPHQLAVWSARGNRGAHFTASVRPRTTPPAAPRTDPPPTEDPNRRARHVGGPAGTAAMTYSPALFVTAPTRLPVTVTCASGTGRRVLPSTTCPRTVPDDCAALGDAAATLSVTAATAPIASLAT